MYETEVRHGRRLDRPGSLAKEAQPREKDIRALAIIPWEEHCSECAIPDCYQSCALYEARSDGRCRRFVNGFVQVRGTPTLEGEMVSVSFKRWAELMAYGNTKLVRIDRVRQVERALRPVTAAARWSPDSNVAILGRRGLSTRLVRRLKQRLAANGPFRAVDDDPPDYFLAEIHNPNPFPVKLSLTIRNTHANPRPSFQALLELPPEELRRHELETSEIAKLVDLSRRFEIILSPNITDDEDEALELLFGVLSFVRDEARRQSRGSPPAPKKAASKYVKVLAWDLDNTLWQGTLIEDGPGKVELRPDVVNVIRELDSRGIVNTLVSKNNEPDVAQELKRFGLDEYMVFPQVGWNPKSLSLKELIYRFNVGEDTFAFIDDSPFEREEVRHSLPAVRVYDAADYLRLVGRPEFQPPQSSESARRREFYVSQDRREKALAEFSGTYEEFLRKWNIQLSIALARAGQLDRITELAQRTNQLNFSGTRYSKAELAGMLDEETLDCYAMSCVDNFGDYGTVGFGIVDKDGPRLIDLMFSCRVQAKRVEHAFLEFLLSRYSMQGSTELLARYVQTERNSAAGKVFDDLGFELISSEEGVKTLRLGLDRAKPGQQPVAVRWEGEPWRW